MTAEVCRAHRDPMCAECDEFNDALWVHPNDLPLPHEDCRLCRQLAYHRELRIAALQETIARLRDELADIERGGRHSAYHESQKLTAE